MSDILQSGQPGGLRSTLSASLIRALAPSQQAALYKSGPLRQFGPGGIIQQRGDDAGGFWLIERGQVSVGQYNPDGSFDALALLGPGDSYGELAVLSGQPRVVDAVAVGEVEARFIPADALDRVLGDDPAAMRRLLAALSMQLQETLDMVVAMRRSQGFDRVAKLLVALAGKQPPPARIAITQQALGELAGISRMTVSEALRCFAGHGLIRLGYRAIEVIDPARLSRRTWRRS